MTLLLPGTQNEHDDVTFGEYEQPAVGVHADAMVFTLTAGRRMSVHGDGRSRACGTAGPAVGRAAEGSSWPSEKAAAGVEPDKGPHRLGDAQPSARPPGRGGQNGEGVAQQVAGAGELIERVGVEPDQFLRAALPEPGQMITAASRTQPAADSGW